MKEFNPMPGLVVALMVCLFAGISPTTPAEARTGALTLAGLITGLLIRR